jgi:1-phosphatidylinositol-3-phosphate 5-kinase
MDIRYYAKVKSVENGSISQCAYIDGVVFRKNVVNKKMPSVIPKARILLFGCSLEFQRTNRMTSFDLAVFQEQEYLSILVSKILTLKPDIIVSRFGVSRIMQEHFVAAGIVLLINVKASTMARLARSTNATILTSAEHVDYLSFSKVLGYCSTFRLERMVSIGGKTKGCTYSIFESSSPERHCTIYLRGADKATLRRLKTCTRAAIHAASNLNIELTLLWSLSCSYRYEDIETELKELHESLSSLEAMDSKLSMSPSLSFSKKRSESDAIKLFEILSDVTPPPISVLSSLDADSRSTDFEFMDSTPSIIDEIVFVECCLVSNSNRLCSVPALRRIKFYSESDVTLKQFLSMVCFNQKWKCTSECKAQKLFKHVISIFHGNGRIQIRVRKLKRPLRQVPDGKMLMWNYCNGCTKIVTPLLVVSEKVGSYSFGKFLETWMYNDKALCKSETCGHRVFRDQEIFFSSNEFVVRFEYSPIFPFSILFASSVPHSMQEILALQSRSPVFGRLGNLEVAKLELQAIRFVSNHMFSSFQMYVSDCVSRLGSVESDEIISKLKSIRDLVNNYRKKFVDSLEDIENEFLSGPEDALLVGQGSLVVLILNGLKAELVSCGIEWNDRLVALKRLEQTIRRQSESKDGSTGSAESMSQAEHSQPMTHSSMEVSPKITEDFKSISPIVLKDITVESEPAAPVPSDPRFLSSWLDPDNGSHFYLHPFLTGCSILVIEDEPSSVVAAALMSLEHVARLNLIAAKQFREHTPAEQLSLCSVIVPENLIELNQESRFKSSVSSEISVNVILNHDADPEHVHTSLSDLNEDKSPEHFDIVADKATEAGELLAGSSSVSFEPIDQELLNQLLSPDVEPFIHKFMLSQNGITTWFECVSYFPVQFNALRRAYLSSDVDFICSISRCMKWSASGGRSGSGFAKTLDDRFILKYVKRREFKMYLQYALQYFQYIGKSMFQRCPSLLVKILGVYQVSWSKSNGNRMSTKHIVIMPNLFYGTDVKAVFDLKGNMRNRFVNTEEPGVPENAVLLDENFLRCRSALRLKF